MGINIAFTSVGRRVELLRLFRRAYQDLRLDGRIIALDIDPLAPALQVAEGRYIVPRLDDPDFIPTLAQICRREHVNLILPRIDADLPVLCKGREEIEQTGARLVMVCPEAAALAFDKWRTYGFFRRLGLLTPCSWLPDHLDVRAMPYPLFIKPRFGNGATNAFKVGNARELEFFMNYVPQPIVQELLPGPEITTDVICDLKGDLLAAVCRQRIEVRSGEVAKGVTIHEPQIIDACVQIARELPAIGPINVQCMLKDGQPCFTEINARLGGGVSLGVRAGADWPRWFLARAVGLDVEIPPLGSYQTGVFLSRYDDSYFLTEADRERMAGHRL
jgi:carbamoyl-phosphate synthase large subunit